MELLIVNMVPNFVGFFGEQLFFEPQSYVLCVHVHPGKLTWNPKMNVWKMIFVFKQVNFTFHVHFPGGLGVETERVPRVETERGMLGFL